jgi:molybdenum-dependent DNA-binding transcriptional regulator ModE
MVKKANLHPYLTSNELKSRYLSSSDRVESVEKHLLWLVSKSWTIQQAAQAVGLNYDYAKEILKGYNQQGEQAIANRRRQRAQPPSNALLNGEQLEQLRSS